jgi:hypothetical protein
LTDPRPDSVIDTDLSALASSLEGVEGWLHLDEATGLYESVARCDVSTPGWSVIEIGSWKGRSTIALALAAKGRGDTDVIAIDPHLGDNGEFYEDAETFSDFTRNIEQAGVADVVRPVRARSHDARPSVDDASVGVLFLDGSHRYEDVSVDLHDWIPSLADGATLVCNDSSKPGVYRALRETVLRRHTAFRDPELVRSTLFVRYQPNDAWTRADDRRWIQLTVVLMSRRLIHRAVPYLPRWVKRAGNRISQRAVHAH